MRRLKASDNTSSFARLSKIFTPAALAWLYPVLLLIPNIALAITEQISPIVKLTNIVLPLGIYFLLTSLSSKVGRTVLLFLPVTILAAFQIVLLYLYGESIIAIDMFLNVVTTNVSEATELLSNLGIAIASVIIIYLPSIIWAIVLMCKKMRCQPQQLSKLKRTGIVVTFIGLIMLAGCYISGARFSIRKHIFPINVTANLIEAGMRTASSIKYHETSDGYTFNASCDHDNDSTEVYVLIIGETSRADNWQLFGYARPTNPRLSARHDIITFPYTLSESNTTHKSVPMMLSNLTAENFGDSIYYVKGIADAFNEAGFNTAFISNQQRNHSLIDFFAGQARFTDFIKDRTTDAKDCDLLPVMKGQLDNINGDKLFIILHTYGSHFNYHERYDSDCRIYTPDNSSEANVENRQSLINTYDNTIIYTDRLIDQVIEHLDSLNIPAALIYVSDHGEDIFDDERGRFLHASPTPTFTQLHVPLLLWASQEYNDLYPEKLTAARDNSSRQVSSSRSVFNTIMSLSGVRSPRTDVEADLCSPAYTEPKRLFLNDYNDGVDFHEAGFRKPDFKKAKAAHISTE